MLLALTAITLASAAGSATSVLQEWVDRPACLHITRPYVTRDLDGDGLEGLVVSVGNLIFYGSDPYSRSLRAVSGGLFDEIGQLGGRAHFYVEHERSAGWLLHIMAPADQARLECRIELEEAARWRLTEETSPVGSPWSTYGIEPLGTSTAMVATTS